MKQKHLLSLMLITLIVIPMSGWAQALFDNQKSKLQPSRLFPILQSTDIVGAPDDYIQTDAIKKIYDRCKSVVPTRFPPIAHDNYCTCAAASTQGTMTVGDLRQLQKDENRKLGNKTFEKYIKNVMKPCMENPIEDIEYAYCISSQDNDWRIKYPVPYCKCVSRAVRKNFEQSGLEQMMIGWGVPTRGDDNDPANTLWYEDSFIKSRNAAKDKCVGSYMDPKNFR